MLATLLLAAAIACTVVGPKSYNEGSEAWCSSGLYARAEVFIDHLPAAFGAELTLNEEGWEVYQGKDKRFMSHILRGGRIVTAFANDGCKAEIRWMWEGKTIFKCTAIPGEDTICKPFEDPIKRL